MGPVWQARLSESPRHDDFPRSFEAAFARLQVVVEEAYVSHADWPDQVAAAIRVAFEFAAEDPEAANLLTNEALANGSDGIARYQRLVGYAAGLLVPGRTLSSDGALLPGSLEHSLAGGITMLVAQRVDRGSAAELPGIAADAIQFALAPYLGSERARQVAAAE